MQLVDGGVADAADNETMHMLRLDHGDTQSDSGTEREADEINAIEAKMVEERYDVCRERGGRNVRVRGQGRFRRGSESPTRLRDARSRSADRPSRCVPMS